MSAETTSGLAASMSAMQNGGRAAMVAAMMSGRGPRADAYVHALKLDLGSPRRPSGAPEAEHVIPAGLGAGPSLPLVTPEAAPPPPARPYDFPGTADGNAQGRILIYWGCGAHARPGQPYEIDLAQLRAGHVPPAMAALAIHAMTPPSASNSATFGEWPNARSHVAIPENGSLVGAHTIRGNYTPDIHFTLAPGQDFLPPIVLTANTPAAGGEVPVAWQPVAGATAYFLMATGVAADHTMILWSSSEVQAAQMAMDYLSPAEVNRLLGQRVLLAPTTSQCTVPAEVASRVQGASLMMTAFGPEANFSYPPRPARAPRGWAPDWTVKLRTRAAYMGLLGRDMAAMMRGEDDEARRPRARQQPQQQERRRRRNPLGGILGGIVPH
jgi:hypothetical protein